MSRTHLFSLFQSLSDYKTQKPKSYEQTAYQNGTFNRSKEGWNTHLLVIEVEEHLAQVSDERKKLLILLTVLVCQPQEMRNPILNQYLHNSSQKAKNPNFLLSWKIKTMVCTWTLKWDPKEEPFIFQIYWIINSSERLLS